MAALAEELTAGCATDYEKAAAISSWVAGHIAYDWDGYSSGEYGDLSAAAVLERGTAVCEGYTNLTAALLRAAGIPAAKSRGYALGYGEKDVWDARAVSGETNHTWNLAWVDSRWVIVDTTWDIFDPSVWLFSNDHFWVE